MNTWQMAMGSALVALCTACVASSGGGGGGGGGGSGTGQDATDSTGAAETAATDSGSAGDGGSASDASAGADAGSQPGDGGSTDGGVPGKDAATPADTVTTDAAVDAQQGSGDAGPAPTDAGPVPSDGGPAPTDGGPKPGDAGPVGPASCESVCKNIAKANCPNDDPYDKCLSGCQGFLQESSKCPPDKVQAFLACASDSVVTCNANGESEAPAACEAMIKELALCLGGGGPPDPPPPPDPCKMGTCYAGGMDPNNPSGKPQCGCSSTCNGNTVAIDCDGSQCFCTLNGQKQAGFEQGTTCDNPQTAMTTLCGKP